MPKPVRFTHFDGLEGAHFESAKGTPEQCDEYTSKDDTRVGTPFKFGTRSKGSGSRTDLIALRDAIKGGRSLLGVYDDNAIVGPAIRYSRGVASLMEVYQSNPPPRPDINVILHFGPAGMRGRGRGGRGSRDVTNFFVTCHEVTGVILRFACPVT